MKGLGQAAAGLVIWFVGPGSETSLQQDLQHRSLGSIRFWPLSRHLMSCPRQDWEGEGWGE